MILTLALNVDIVGFVLGSWHLADAYNDAMVFPLVSSPLPGEMLPLSLAIVAAFLLLALVNWRAMLKDLDFLFAYLMVAGYIYLVFKHAYVRTWGHPWYFFQSVPAAIGLLALYAGPSLRRWTAGVFVVALLCAFPAGAQLYSSQPVAVKARRLQNYVAMAVGGSPYYPGNPDRQAQALPQSVLDLIGDASVDVMPWEISTVYFNDLRYDPRPVAQSYTTYDGWLDERNYEKYISETAPEFILFAMGDIDRRHPAFTEPRTAARPADTLRDRPAAARLPAVATARPAAGDRGDARPVRHGAPGRVHRPAAVGRVAVHHRRYRILAAGQAGALLLPASDAVGHRGVRGRRDAPLSGCQADDQRPGAGRSLHRDAGRRAGVSEKSWNRQPEGGARALRDRLAARLRA